MYTTVTCHLYNSSFLLSDIYTILYIYIYIYIYFTYPKESSWDFHIQVLKNRIFTNHLRAILNEKAEYKRAWPGK